MREKYLPAFGAALLALATPTPAGAAETPAASERSMPARLAARSLLLDAADRPGLAVAVGERGHVLVSRDGGASWTQAEAPTRALLTGVFLHDGRLGWAVGHDGTILRTRDGGVTWQRVRYAPEEERPLLGVWFRDESRGSRSEPTASSSRPPTAARAGRAGRSSRGTTRISTPSRRRAARSSSPERRARSTDRTTGARAGRRSRPLTRARSSACSRSPTGASWPSGSGGTSSAARIVERPGRASLPAPRRR